MDPEQTYLRVHARLSGMLSQLLTPRIRTALEYAYLVIAIALFCLLVVMHTNFVAQPGCSSEFSGSDITEAHLVQIKITSAGLWSQKTYADTPRDNIERSSMDNFQILDVDTGGFMSSSAKFWLGWLGAGARKGKGLLKSWRHDVFELQAENAADSSGSRSLSDGAEMKVIPEAAHVGMSPKESFRAAVIHFWRKWQGHFSSLWTKTKYICINVDQLWKKAEWKMLLDVPRWFHTLHFKRPDILIGKMGGRGEAATGAEVQWLENRSKTFEPTYLYSVEKGYFMLPEGAKSRHNVRTVNVSISAQNSCFGNRWQQLLINSFVGYDTILMNSLLSAPGQGYLYNFQTKEFYDLSYSRDSAEVVAKFEDYLVAKCGVLIMSLFVFFTTTMSVSFTLRETQSRMLKFTVQLQHHARHRLPTFQLIFVHVIESLVFVPIMIGILFFLFEFYDDQLLAFMVLTLVWLCELFTMISVRTPISMQYFPRFFLLYFLVFHIYFFSYAYGFSYLAFATTAAFMQHLVLYFWNRFEVPALQRFMRHRMQLQQQGGVHITSSTILTSTLHIARLNTRNPSPPTDHATQHAGDVHTVTATGAEVAHPADGSSAENQGAGGPLLQPLGSGNQVETVQNTNSLNSFASLLLWALGGGSSDGLVSFLSMFRDMREQGQAYAQTPRGEENNQPPQTSWWRRF
ncbi:Membralin [Nymphaea thermarum]|nr:Membralin [Nymphaea thermarum]